MGMIRPSLKKQLSLAAQMSPPRDHQVWNHSTPKIVRSGQSAQSSQRKKEKVRNVIKADNITPDALLTPKRTRN